MTLIAYIVSTMGFTILFYFIQRFFWENFRRIREALNDLLSLARSIDDRSLRNRLIYDQERVRTLMSEVCETFDDADLLAVLDCCSEWAFQYLAESHRRGLELPSSLRETLEKRAVEMLGHLDPPDPAPSTSP